MIGVGREGGKERGGEGGRREGLGFWKVGNVLKENIGEFLDEMRGMDERGVMQAKYFIPSLLSIAFAIRSMT